MLMNIDRKYIKASIALVAFVILSSALSLSFKDKSSLAGPSANSQLANTGNASTQRDEIDYQKASKATGLPVESIQKFVSQAKSGAAGCLSNFGQVTVNHALCTPPGPGKWTGQPDKPGKNLRPCPVSGAEGGSITALCFNGCCRAISVSGLRSGLGSSGGLGSLSGILGQTLGQMLGKLMQGEGSDSGSYSDRSWVADGDSIEYPSITNDADLNSNFDYLASDPGTLFNTDSGSVLDNNNALNTASKEQNIEEDLLETVLLKPEEKREEQEAGQAAADTRVAINLEERPVVETEIDEINKSQIYNYEFQNLEKAKNNDPRIAALRDPDKSSVSARIYRDSNDIILPEYEKEEKSWWQRFLDWLLAK